MLNPDARGIWVQAFIGTLFAGDNFFFAFFPFLYFHYTITWVLSPVNQLPPTDMAAFIMSMAFAFSYGAFGGVAHVYALRIRALVPTQTFLNKRPHLGAILLVYGAVIGVRGAAIQSGAANVHDDFFSFSGSGSFGYWFAFVGGSFVFVSVLLLTCRVQRPKNVMMWFTISYPDNLADHVISDYIIAAIALLVPQAAWNFLVLDPHLWTSPQAGAVTLGIEVVVWIAIYFWFTRVRKTAALHFSHAQSYVTFLEFVLIAGITQVGSGVIYLILDVFMDPGQEEFATTILLDFSIVASFIMYFVFGARRVAQRKQVKAEVKGVRERLRGGGGPLSLWDPEH